MARVTSRRSSSVVRAALLSLAIGAVILGVKLAAWLATGSTVLLADALESIVNVVAAGLATYSVMVASRPADTDHPYGHGKAEFLSAAVEGALILLAATVIVAESVHRLILGPQLERVSIGVGLAVLGGCANLGLGLYLVRTGRAARSPAIEADGKHILADVYTTVGAVLALLLASATSWAWIDPVAGVAVALGIMWTGWQVVRQALAGLLDEADFDVLEQASKQLEEARGAEWIDVHELRMRRSGAFRHIDAHLVVPRYYTIEHAHASAERLEATLLPLVGEEGGVIVHVDPCRPSHCATCSVDACPVRGEPLRERRSFDRASITRGVPG